MDNSPINTPGTTASPPPTDGGYQQYLGAEPPKSNKKLILIIAGAVLGILIIILAVVFSLKGDKNDSQTGQDQSGQTQITVNCTDKTCLEQNFSKCLPAEYTLNESGSSVKYKVTGIQDIGCKVDVEYLDSKTFGAAVGKKMTCDFDTKVSFDKAAQNVYNYPDDYECQGELSDLIKSLDAENSP